MKPTTPTYNPIKAILFDLDGVLTDTAEYHYQAWKRLAGELDIPFSRADNESLRGVARRPSIEFILGLGDRTLPEDEIRALMDRKNGYYRSLLTQVSPDDLLPGVLPLLEELHSRGLRTAIASASKNSPEVVDRLGLNGRVDALVHGGHIHRQKPAPDLFLEAARRLDVPAGACIVVEDAAAGITAARAAGMASVGIGPRKRVGEADRVFPSLEGVSAADLLAAAGWRVIETALDPEEQHPIETIFTIGNGYLGTRGSFEERYPGDWPATLLHGMYDDAPVVFTELANAPDWTAVEVWVDGRRFDMQQSGITDYARWLDLRTAALHRRLRWQPEGTDSQVEIVFLRFASLAREHELAEQVQVTCLAGSPSIRIRAALDAHVENHGLLHWMPLSQSSTPDGAKYVAETRYTGKRIALHMGIQAGGVPVTASAGDCRGLPAVQLNANLSPEDTLTVDKLVAVYTSRDTDAPAAAAETAIRQALERGLENIFIDHSAAWQEFWDVSDVIIGGDPEAQVAVRHGLLQLRIAAPTHDDTVSIGAKTLSGLGYAGHIFWDNEIFVLPYFTYTQPGLARNMLCYRQHTLPGARAKAAGNGYAGAQFAWESAEIGEEVTPTWVPDPDSREELIRIWTGDIQIHISADIAYALHQYWQATGDDAFWRDTGLPIVLETAVFWGERVEPEPNGRFSLRNVIGCDEYHDHVDNNAYTNGIVRWHLQTALDGLAWLEEHAPQQADALRRRLQLDSNRLAHWQQVIDGLVILHDPHTGLIEQFEGFFELKDVDWPAYAGRTQSMQAILGIEGANEYKVLKQADVIALLALLGDCYDEKTWRANWEYYVPITDHEYGSSLGPAMHAWVACRMGQPEQAYGHFMRAARADLVNIRGNAGYGMHAASIGGMWQALVFGFAGLTIDETGPLTEPRLPSHWDRLAFHIMHRGQLHRIDIRR